MRLERLYGAQFTTPERWGVELGGPHGNETHDLLFAEGRCEGRIVASLRAANGYAVLIYQKPGHVRASHMILNFPVDDIEAAVDELRNASVEFEQYEEGPKG